MYTNFLEKKLPEKNIPSGVIEAIITLLTIMQIMNKKSKKHRNASENEKLRVMREIKEDY
jgi:hypothetical protein